jgi:hypothetical protein
MAPPAATPRPLPLPLLPLLLLLLPRDARAQDAGAVTVSVYANSGLAGAPAASFSRPSLELSFPVAPGATFSAEVSAQLSFPAAPAFYAVDCGAAFDASVTVGFVHVDDHLVCSKGAYLNSNGSYDGSQGFPIYRRPGTARAAVVRARLYAANATAVGEAVAFSLPWCEMAAPGGACALAPIPPALLAPGLPPAEAQRLALQRSLAQGWGLFLHASLTAAVLLPAGLRLNIVLCELGGACLLGAIMDDGAVRVGLHAHDRSIAQMFLSVAGLNASVSVLGGAGASGLQVLVEPVTCGAAGDCGAFAVAVTADFIWGRAGAVASDGAALSAAPAGLPNVRLLSATAGPVAPVDPARLASNVTSMAFVAVSLASGAVAFSTSGAPSVAAVTAAAAAAAAAEAARYERYGSLAETAQAVQAAVAWNAIYTPAEEGVFPPVSRMWSSDDPAPTDADPDEWSYVIFCWDNLFGALLAGASSRELALARRRRRRRRAVAQRRDLECSGGLGAASTTTMSTRSSRRLGGRRNSARAQSGARQRAKAGQGARQCDRERARDDRERARHSSSPPPLRASVSDYGAPLAPFAHRARAPLSLLPPPALVPPRRFPSRSPAL